MNEDKPNSTKKINPVQSSYDAVPRPSTSIGKRINTRTKQVKKPESISNINRDMFKKATLLFVVVVVIGFSTGWLGSYFYQKNRTGSLSTAKEIVSSQSQVVSAIAKSVDPSVVSISSSSSTSGQDIFGNPTSTPQVSEGTGILVSSSGYIVTNRHVISGATNVKVTLYDGTTINDVKIIGTTSANDSLDIGFLKINNSPKTLQPALLGNSSLVQVGDSVVAIGNALGQFQNTVTSGIISGHGRSIQAGDSSSPSTTGEDLNDLFQTDAAINPGNSGGPLINIKGEVIGINTALASNGAQNIGFSIPINNVEGLIKSVISNGTISRPYIGVYYVPVTQSIAKKYNLNVTNGAYIPQDQAGQSSVISGSPADKAGLQAGDVIVSVNGTEINSNSSLSSLIDQSQVGSTLTLNILRGGTQKIIQVNVGQEPAS